MKKLIYSLMAIILVVGFIWFDREPEKADAVAGQLSAKIATTSPINVSTANLIIFATSTCASRIISTASSSIMIKFADISGQTLSAISGFWQTSSSTVAYDASVYGCGSWTARSATVLDANFTVAETN